MAGKLLADAWSEPELGARRARFSLDAAASIAIWIIVYVCLRDLASILAVTFGISAWYPPAAISLLVMIRHGLPGALGIFGATVFTSIETWSAPPGVHNVAASLAHTGAYGLAAFIYRSRVGCKTDALRPRSILALLAAALVGSALASLFGNLNHYVESGGAHDLTFERLFGWMTGDLFGVISLCPFLLFAGPARRRPRLSVRGLLARVGTPLAAVLIAVAIAGVFGLISRNADVGFRLATVVGVGVYSVIVAHVVSPRSTLAYLFVISMLAAAWLSTEVAPTARIEFAVQIVTFLAASYTMIALSMERMRQRAIGRVRFLRIHDLADQRDALERRIGVIEREFAELAHELRTPLGGIIGLLEVTEGGVAAGGADPASVAQREQVSRYFRHMRGCALYLNALVDDAFDVARLSRAGFEPSITTVDLRETLEALDLIARTKRRRAVDFVDRTDGGPLLVRTDRNRLLQILINLLVNAIRYAEREDSVRVSCASSAEHVTITVENASSAITAVEMERHLKGTHGPSANSQGLGIGLPLVGRLSNGIGARLATTVSDGTVAISVTTRRA